MVDYFSWIHLKVYMIFQIPEHEGYQYHQKPKESFNRQSLWFRDVSNSMRCTRCGVIFSRLFPDVASFDIHSFNIKCTKKSICGKILWVMQN